jgi:hypothetical protein
MENKALQYYLSAMKLPHCHAEGQGELEPQLECEVETTGKARLISLKLAPSCGPYTHKHNFCCAALRIPFCVFEGDGIKARM